jgi:hypothetical protein|tara:strand:+ start:749 stop:1336 length:588 start_codon:yes stop_codon:yes gene_type:complete
MGGPKQKDYEAGPEEKAAASAAKFEYDRDKSLYGPITREFTKEVETTKDPGAIGSRVANADTMQALTMRPSLAATQSVDASANLASGAVSQQLQASQQALLSKQNMKLGALEIGKNRKAVTKLGLSDIASQERSAGLATAKRKLVEQEAAISGALQLGTTFAYAYGENKAMKKDKPPDIYEGGGVTPFGTGFGKD